MEIPRRLPAYGSDPIGALQADLGRLWTAVQSLERATTLRDASISGGRGLRILEETPGNGDVAGEPRTRIWISPNGTITVYDDGGAAAVRFGTMTETALDPGTNQYGIEVKVGNDWIQLGTQTVDWSNVGNKPSEFRAAPHDHPGSAIVGAVGRATSADTAGLAALADGSRHAFQNTVSGTQFYAVWVGNDGGFHLGRNTSSLRYKEDVRAAAGDPKAVLKVEPVLFKRRATMQGPRMGTIGPELLVPASEEDEFGVIAEQSHEHVPEATQWFDGQVDGVRYELYGVLLIPVVRDHEERIEALEKEVTELRKGYDELLAEVKKMRGTQ